MVLNNRVQFNPNSVIPDLSLIAPDSYNCSFHRSTGIIEFNSKRINPGAGAFSTNLWQVTGYVEIKAIYAEFTDVTNVVGGPTGCSFDLNDGVATVQITSAAGVNCAGVTLGSIIKKTMAAANAATLLDASQCRFSELTVGGAARPFSDLTYCKRMESLLLLDLLIQHLRRMILRLILE